MNMEKIVARLSNRPADILGNERFSKYAVLIPLVERKDGIHILFEVRSLQLRRQPGEICFPGGKIDKEDKNQKQTAIRETLEELGISESSIQVISPLDYMVSPFGTIIYPYVGSISEPEKIELNPMEVAKIFTVPLSFFQKTQPQIYEINFRLEPESDFPFNLIPGGENYNWQTRKMKEYFYLYEDKVIWGLTAKLVHHFIDVLNQ